VSISNLPVSKKYSDIKILVQDLMADYPDVTNGIIVLFNTDGEMLNYQCCTQSQCAFAAAELLKKAAE
jgi:hypothetical protein